MAKLTADEIAGAVCELEFNTRTSTVADILTDLEDFARDYEKHHEPERVAGFRDAIDTIRGNY